VLCVLRYIAKRAEHDDHLRVDFALGFPGVEYLAQAGVARFGRATENR
jgi:hypothetical protein